MTKLIAKCLLGLILYIASINYVGHCVDKQYEADVLKREAYFASLEQPSV